MSLAPRHLAQVLIAAVAISSFADAAVGHQGESSVTCAAVGSTNIGTGEVALGCTIGGLGETDTFAFLAEPGDRIRVIVLAEAEFLDAQLEVRDFPGGQTIATSSCDSGAEDTPVALPRCSAFVEFIAQVDVYNAFVSDVDGDETGEYLLQLEVVPSADPADLVDEDSREDFSALEQPTDVDYFSVTAGLGQTLDFEVRSCDDYFDPRIEIYDPNDELVADVHCETPMGPRPLLFGPTTCSDDAPQAEELCTASVEVPVETSGVHSMVISDASSDEPGRYEWEVTRLPEPSGIASSAALLTLALLRGARNRPSGDPAADQRMLATSRS